jgi:spore coat polysaccharide biosynthesis protein SpsF
MKIVACIVARTISTRLPLKVLRDVRPELSMIDFLVKRVKDAEGIDETYICTSNEAVDDIFEDIALRNKVKIYRGSPDEVIERLVAVVRIENADAILRITGDNPFTAVEYVKKQIDLMIDKNLDYVRLSNVPIGTVAELIASRALFHCFENIDPKVSEYLLFYLFEPKTYKCGVLEAFKNDYSVYSLSVDLESDLIRTKRILDLLNFKSLSALKAIELSQIVKVIIENEPFLPNISLKKGGSIKYPYNKIVRFQDFETDMERRRNGSVIFKNYD